MKVHSDEEASFSKDDGSTGLESGFIVAEDEIEIENVLPSFADVCMDDFEGGDDDFAGGASSSGRFGGRRARALIFGCIVLVIACLGTTFGMTSSSSKSVQAELYSRMLTKENPTKSEEEKPKEPREKPRATALAKVISRYYPDRAFDFDSKTNQYAALELLANSNKDLVPVPDKRDKGDGAYLLLQRYVLVLLYLDTDGDEWEKGKWLDGEADKLTCNWSGVTCSDGSTIDELDLYGNGLAGSLPTEIGFLTTIEKLDLDSNELTGPIPSEIGDLSALQELYLDSNELTGPIPSEIGDLSAQQNLK